MKNKFIIGKFAFDNNSDSESSSSASEQFEFEGDINEMKAKERLQTKELN